MRLFFYFRLELSQIDMVKLAQVYRASEKPPVAQHNLRTKPLSLQVHVDVVGILEEEECNSLLN